METTTWRRQAREKEVEVNGVTKKKEKLNKQRR